MNIKEWIINNALRYVLIIMLLVMSGVLFWRTYATFSTDPEYYYVHQILGIWLCIARGSAAILNLWCAVILLPMCRSVTTLVRTICRKINVSTARVITDSSRMFHMWCGYMVVVFSVIHVGAHCINVYNYTRYTNYKFPAVNPWYKTQEHIILVVLESIPGWTGVIMLVILLMLSISSLKLFRYDFLESIEKRATIGPPAKRHSNGIAFRWWAYGGLIRFAGRVILLRVIVLLNDNVIRRNESRWFNTFWYTHKTFVVFYALAVIHGLNGPVRRQLNIHSHFPGCNDTFIDSHHQMPDEGTINCIEPPEFGHSKLRTWLWLVGPFTLYLLDCMYRFIRGSTPVLVKSMTYLSDSVISITLIHPGFAVKPGQSVLIRDPCVSSVEWHPYSIVQNKESKEFTIWLKDIGDWSGDVKHHLEQIFQKDVEASSDIQTIKNRTFYMDGPYFSPLQDILKFDVSICIAGGVGVTPFLAQLNYISDNIHRKNKLKKLVIILTSRDISFILGASNYIGEIVNTIHNVRPDLVDVRFHLTKQHLSVEQMPNGLPYGHLTLGRPRFGIVLTELSSFYAKSRFGVFACGSSGLTHDVKKICQKSNHGKNIIYFHKESF